MSGMVECYLINQDGRQCNFSPAVTNTRVIFGKNQPFLGVEITVAKYMFDSDDFWSGQTPSGTTLLTRPELIQNSTLIHIKTYGGEYDLVYTQTLNPDDMTYVLLCYTKMWQSKTTEVSSLISDIVWSGQSETYTSGTLAITCNGITTNTQIGGAFLPTDGAGVSKNNVQIVKPSRVNVTPPISTLASIGILRVLVPIYQDPTIPTDALVGYTEPTGEVSFDDLEHTMRADTVYASILFEYAGPFSKQDLNNYYKGIFANLIIPQVDAYILHALNKVQQNINGEMVVRSGMQEDGILYCKGVEYVTGYGQTLFAWLSNAIGGYAGTDLVIDKGYKMESSAEILSKLGFDTETLAAYKANDNPPTARTYGDSIYKLVPDTICYDLIKAVSIATNRTAFFADVPYLSSFEVAESDYNNALSELTIQYTPSDSSYCAYFIPLGETEPQQITLGSGVEYNDQGSTYLVGEQTARSANASVTVKATDAGTDIAGMPVEVNIDTASIDSSKEILAQVAFNTLVENYHPSNTLSFIALENTSIPIETTYVAYMTLATGLPDPSPSNNGKYYINAGVADVNLYLSNGTTWTATTPTTGDSVTVYAPSNTYYFVFNGTVWVEYRAYAGVERRALFRPDTRCATLEDTRSHTTLTNVPLAYTVLSWPDCTTRYMFGEPIFQDTEETIADLQVISKQSVTNTSVSEALSKPYVTTVIGNMSLDEAGDDLTDFSGLILQRNESTGVASMDGYMGGQRQARFSSDGTISSGVVTYHSPRSSDPTALSEAGDSVVMDRDGFHTRSWHLYPQTSPQFSYADGYWVEETRIGVDGEISAGAGSVVLGHDGLINYDSDGEPAYTLDDDGLKYKGQPIINSENGKIQLKVDGAAIDGNLRAVSITLPYVQIDNEGLRTFDRYFWDTDKEEYQYFTGDLQCSVGTNGVITAGAGAVKLDQYGLSTWTGAVASDILGGWNYTNATRQCAVTTDGELIAGANLYKLDATGLSYNFGQGTGLINWQNILTYNATEDRVELYPSIYVKAAEVESLSADKITTGTIQANVSIDCAGTIWAGQRSVKLDSTGLTTYNNSGQSPVAQCTIGTDGVLTAGGGAVKLDVNGLTTYNTLTQQPTVQCTIGADGVITAGTTKISNSGIITYYSNDVSAVISNQGRVAIGGGGQQAISIAGGLIKFYGTGSTIAADGTVTGTLGAYITSNGTIMGLAADSVNSTQIVNGAVTTAKIDDDAITSDKISAGAVVNEALATNAVDAINIKDDAVTTTKIVDTAITNAKIGQLAVQEANIDNLAVSSGKIKDAAITTAKIDDLAVTDAKISTLSAGKITTGIIGVDVELALQNTGARLVAGPAQTADGTAYWKAILDNTGLTTYGVDPEHPNVVNPVCSIDANGNIIGITISADQITAGTIDATKVGVKNIDAGQITSGTIDSDRITSASIASATISASKVTAGTLRSAIITLPYVQMDDKGLRTFSRYFWDSEKEEYLYYIGDLQCSIGTDGVITAGAGAVKLDGNGLTTYDITDTTSSNVVQCSVGTNGAIIAGSNLVTLNDRGITVGSTEATAATILSLNSKSFFTVSDDTNSPSICISDAHSTFKNNVEFGNDISVSDEIYIGNNMGKFAPRQLTISSTSRSGNTITTGTGTYNSIVISPQSQIALVSSTTLYDRIGNSYIGVPTITQSNLTSFVPTDASSATARIMGRTTGGIVLAWETSKKNQPYYKLDWGVGISVAQPSYFNTRPSSAETSEYLAVTLDSNYPSTGTLYSVAWNDTTSKFIYTAKANALYTKSDNTYTLVETGTVLNIYTLYYAKKHSLSVASVLNVDVPISWTATSATGGALNEVIQITLGYQTYNMSSRYSQYEGISSEQITSWSTKKSTTTILTSTTAGSSTLHFELKNNISLVNDTLEGEVINALLFIEITSILPLTHTVTIDTFQVSSLVNITGNELMVSNGGIWGSTVIPTPDGSGGLNFLNYGSAPIANTTYVSSYVNSYSTSSSTMGLKRVIVLPSGDSLPTYGRDGDICIFVAR